MFCTKNTTTIFVHLKILQLLILTEIVTFTQIWTILYILRLLKNILIKSFILNVKQIIYVPPNSRYWIRQSSYDCVSNKVAPILFTNRRRTDCQTSQKEHRTAQTSPNDRQSKPRLLWISLIIMIFIHERA